MKKLSLGLFAVAVVMFSTNMSHAAQWQACGIHHKCYTLEQREKDAKAHRPAGECSGKKFDTQAQCEAWSKKQHWIFN